MRARLILLALALAGASAGPAVAGGDTSLTATDNAFSPRTAHLRVRQAVTWTNRGAVAHEVTAVDGSFVSGNIKPGASFTFTPTKPGTFAYYCRYHGTATSGMVGTLSVASTSGALPQTGGGREVATGIAVIALTMVVGLGFRIAAREGNAA